MAGLLNNISMTSRFWNVLKSVGDSFLSIDKCSTVLKRYIYAETPQEISRGDKQDHETMEFTKEAQSILQLYPELQMTLHDDFKQLHSYCLQSALPVASILITNRNDCRECGRKLVIEDKCHTVVIYDNTKGTYLGSRITKICRRCKICEHYGYFTKGGNRQFCMESALENKFLLSSEDTAFDMELLTTFKSLLVVGALPFSTFSEAYDRRFNYRRNAQEEQMPRYKRTKREGSAELQELLTKREKMDRRRFEEGYLLYAALHVMRSYSIILSHIPYDRNSLLASITNEYHEGFVKKWGDHLCSKNGCQDVVVLDGNMKNCRQVCSVKNAQELRFEDLDGSIAIGCLNTPAKGERICIDHFHQACKFKDDLHEEHNSEIAEVLPLRILNNKETRNETFFEILWNDGRTSWLKKRNMPKSIGGLLAASVEEFGQIRKVLKTGSALSADEVTNPFVSSGFGKEENQDNHFEVEGVAENVTCGTEKGKHKSKNCKSAGIVVFEKPCGIVIDVKEIYGSESKSQVYGHLHDLLRKDNMKDINVLCYDDACHLKKFALNPSRRDTTLTAKRMSNMDIVCDRFHFKNHVGKWCKQNCDPKSCLKLKGVNTEICEQLFSWLSKFAPITKHMNRYRFMFLMLHVLDEHNGDYTS